jgi:hypothetical protein
MRGQLAVDESESFGTRLSENDTLYKTSPRTLFKRVFLLQSMTRTELLTDLLFTRVSPQFELQQYTERQY